MEMGQRTTIACPQNRSRWRPSQLAFHRPTYSNPISYIRVVLWPQQRRRWRKLLITADALGLPTASTLHAAGS